MDSAFVSFDRKPESYESGLQDAMKMWVLFTPLCVYSYVNFNDSNAILYLNASEPEET